MKYTVFRNSKRRRLLKNLEVEYIHEKRRKCDNETIKNDFSRKPCSRNRNPTSRKLWWSKVYNNWSDDSFKDTFNQILLKIREQIELTPTNLNPFPKSHYRQLALTTYRLATGCSYAILSDV